MPLQRTWLSFVPKGGAVTDVCDLWWQQHARALLDGDHLRSDKERAFVEQMLVRERPPTQRQAMWLEGLTWRACHGAFVVACEAGDFEAAENALEYVFSRVEHLKAQAQ